MMHKQHFSSGSKRERKVFKLAHVAGREINLLDMFVNVPGAVGVARFLGKMFCRECRMDGEPL